MATLVHRRGYAATGVEDVCRLAGVKKGSFYHFFPSKTALMLAAMDWHAERGRALFEPAIASAARPAERLAQVLVSLGWLEAQNVRSGGAVLGCPFGNLIAEVAGGEPAILNHADVGLRRMGEALTNGKPRKALKRGGARGEAADATTDEADALVAFFEGVSLLAKARNDPRLFGRLAPSALKLAGETAGGGPSTRRRRLRRPVR